MKAKELKTEKLVNPSIDRGDVVWIDIKQTPFKIYGFYKPESDGQYRRIPADVAEATSKSLVHLSTYTVGGRVRFSTNSPYIAIHFERTVKVLEPIMEVLGQRSFDVYRDSENGSEDVGSFCPNGDKVLSDSGEMRIFCNKEKDDVKRFETYTDMNCYTIDFPYFSPVDKVLIGLRADSEVGYGAEYKIKKPIVFYGSSIVHGVRASRSGFTYPARVSRALNADYINLGFSGAALGETPICDYIAGLEMSALVFDYDHNAPTPEHLKKTHLPFYKAIREKQPDLPIVLATRPDYYGTEDDDERRKIVRETYEYALEHGDKNITMIDGKDFYESVEFDRADCTADGCHPNDIGYCLMAKHMIRALKEVMKI